MKTQSRQPGDSTGCGEGMQPRWGAVQGLWWLPRSSRSLIGQTSHTVLLLSLAGVLVSEGCFHRNPQTRCLSHQELTFSELWG